MLDTGLLHNTVFTGEANILASTPHPQYGLVVDSSQPLSGKSYAPWNMFDAAVAGRTRSDIRDQIIDSVHAFATLNSTRGPFAMLYDPTSGNATSGLGSPAAGAMFAALALK